MRPSIPRLLGGNHFRFRGGKWNESEAGVVIGHCSFLMMLLACRDAQFSVSDIRKRRNRAEAFMAGGSAYGALTTSSRQACENTLSIMCRH